MEMISMPNLVVAYLGIGIMGEGMVRNLQKHGFTLRLYNRTLQKAQVLANKTTTAHATPADAARGADVIIACVLDDEASRLVWFGETGAVQTAKSETICIEMSTLSAPYADRWSEEIKKKALHAIDCPVTGSKKGAQEATLSLFLGGNVKDIAKVQPIFSAISTQQFYFGAHGSGSRFKLMYNLLGGSILVALAEAIGFAEKLGLDKQQVLSVLSESDQSWSSAAARSKGAQLVTRNHSDISVTLDIIRKDVSYALASAHNADYHPAIAHSVHQTLTRAQEDGLGKLDMSAVGNLFIEKN
jgi:3-hydroxyisobutyrate dehydrogenase